MSAKYTMHWRPVDSETWELRSGGDVLAMLYWVEEGSKLGPGWWWFPSGEAFPSLKREPSTRITVDQAMIHQAKRFVENKIEGYR
jgi:hypothetical protein